MGQYMIYFIMMRDYIYEMPRYTGADPSLHILSNRSNPPPLSKQLNTSVVSDVAYIFISVAHSPQIAQCHAMLMGWCSW